MNVVIAFCNTDKDQAVRQLKWIAELGIVRGHKLWLMPAGGIDATEHFSLAPLAFENWGTIQDADGVTSDWGSGHHVRDCSGPNSTLRQIAWHFEINKLGHWLFLEPDCLPTKKGWADIWEAEYIRGGKPFMGGFVRVPKVMDHLTGISMYPENTVSLAPNVVSRRHADIEGRVVEIAFDVAGATEILPQAHLTNLIQHCPRHAGFKSMEEVDALLDPNAVLFHMQKDGSLIPFLREKIFGQKPVLAGNGVQREVSTEVLEICPSHETSSKKFSEPKSIASQIRFHAESLENIVNGNASRGLTVVAELRKRKLIPQARKRK